MATSLKTTTRTTRKATATMATRICMMLLSVWLGICLTLADAARTGGSGGRTRYYGSSSGVGTGGGYTSTTGTSDYGSSSSSSNGMNGYYGGDSNSLSDMGMSSDYGSVSSPGGTMGDSNSYSGTYTSTSQGVGAGVGTGGRGGGGSGFSVFFGSRHRTQNSNQNGDNYDDQGMPLVFIILFWLMVVAFAMACCYCCTHSYMRDSPESQKSRFDSRVATAKDQVKRQGQNKSAVGTGTDDGENNNNNTIGRPPADGSYVATYTAKGQAVSTTMNLYFSPNIQDSNTSWYIVGRGKCTNTSSVATGDDAACQEFKITEGVIAESGHAYWVQQKQNASSNDRSLTTGKFEFDHGHAESGAATGSNWCSFTGSILTHDGDQAAYTSFQLEKDCVVHAVALPIAASSGTTTDVESNGEDDDVEVSY